ncbi:MAG: prepilin peptidase, partial [Candidatus Wildermuthbacteria bacterium]|nr:prepilin peptidase [Candidatus Wildermuthbacteria bacterium]
MVFLFGAAMGSFLNSVLYRFEQGESALKGRSYCPSCRHALAWYDLLPLASFFLLRGKCRHCRAAISWQYPAVESATGVGFAAIFYTHPSLFQALVPWAALCVLMLIAVYDGKHYRIPDVFVYALGAVALVGISAETYRLGQWSGAFDHALAALLAGMFFLALYVFSRGRWIGFGDVQLAFAMGLLLGLSSLAVALAIAFALGAMVGLLLMRFKKKTLKSELPFAPFLAFGALSALVAGE